MSQHRIINSSPLSRTSGADDNLDQNNEAGFDDPSAYQLVTEEDYGILLPRFGVLHPPQLPIRDGRRARRKRTYEEIEDLALQPVPRKKPMKSDKLVHHGRHFCRTIYAFPNMHALITNGLTVDNTGARPETQQQRRAHRVYRKLLNLVPGLSDRLEKATDNDMATIATLLQRGANQARSDDTKGLKPVIIDWLAPPDAPLHPSLSRTVKVDRGFNHDRTGELLCPPHINWSNERIREQLRNRSIIIGGEELPSFLWEEGTYDRNNIWNGFFRNQLLVKAFKHVFTSPSSVDAVPKATRSGNARIHGMTSATVPSLAYIAVQVRFALSSETAFIRAEAGSESEKFYLALLDIFEDVHQQHKVVELLAWYNKQVFPAFTNSKRIVAEDSPYALFKAYSQSIKESKGQKALKPSNKSRTKAAAVASSSKKTLDSVQEERGKENEEEQDENQNGEEINDENRGLGKGKGKPPRAGIPMALTPKPNSFLLPSRVTRSAAKKLPGFGL
ncbi:hypothetical protein CC2G_004204 [Coprinopsis cinerea AmutBmut pab1-1]|nr:hypothetical protein CC2G_004204 [Coprinopsis cinerea AmutBmut pab1-1]